MVKEVEIANIYEYFEAGKQYSISDTQPIFEASLSNEGIDLHLDVYAPLPSQLEGGRKIYLWFGNIDFDNLLVDYVLIQETEMDSCIGLAIGRSKVTYDFDLYKVVTIPRKIYNTQGTSEIIVELYTYEANITTDYGYKRLSVPYTITSDSKYKYDKSTDGMYRLAMIDFPKYDTQEIYYTGDIVVWADGLLMSTVDNNTEVPDTGINWKVPEEEDIINFASGYSVHRPLRAIISHMLISRYAKYAMIKDAIEASSFKDYDDGFANSLANFMQAYRERAKMKLLANRPIDAAYELQQLKLAYSGMADKTKIRNFNIKYTYTGDAR